MLPKDSDGDLLPDAYEADRKFWIKTSTGTFEQKTYSINNAHSGGEDQPLDSLTDGDRDIGDTPVHDNLGDGYSAFEEYRGLFIGRLNRVTHKRFHELTNDGPGGGNGGPGVKDFFYFESGDLLKPDNAMLKEGGISWHRIQVPNWTDAQATGRNAKAGLMNPNTPPGSLIGSAFRAGILIIEAQETDPGSSSTPKVSDRVPVKIDSNESEKTARELRLTQAEAKALKDYVLAHELLHKLTIDHPADRSLTFVQTISTDALPTPSIDVYSRSSDNSDARYYAPAALVQVQANTFQRNLEPPLPPIVGGINAHLSRLETPGVVKVMPESITITRHNVGHRAILYAYPTNVKPKDAFPETEVLTVYTHSGFLNDHVADPKDLAKKLADAVKKKPDPTK